MIFHHFYRRQVDTKFNGYPQLKEKEEFIRQPLLSPSYLKLEPTNSGTKVTFVLSGTQDQEPVDSIEINTKTPAELYISLQELFARQKRGIGNRRIETP